MQARYVNPGPRPERFLGKQYQSTLDKVAHLYNRLDAAYGGIAEQYGFVCNGCEENCCETLFFHHTLAEYAYLYSGFNALTSTFQEALVNKAHQVHRQQKPQSQSPLRVFCPLNNSERCLLYDYRPMICRLHGIPHELKSPGRQTQFGPGCGAFSAACSPSPYIPFDRTPFYREMAAIEQELRQSAGFNDKIKITVAQMLLAFTAK